jgi:hypothetical protein
MEPPMKKQSVLKFFLPLLLVAFVFMSCEVDNNPVQTLEQVIERIPAIEPIQGADNATVIVRSGEGRSHFKIAIENTSSFNGVYNAWCIELGVPVETGMEYSGTPLYATDKDKIFNKLNYIINNRNAYEREMVGLSWKDIQVAFWVILETQDYNLAAIENRVSGSIPDFNPTYVNTILDDVKANANSFEPGMTDTRLFYYELQGGQNGVGEKLGTAMARMTDDPNALIYQFDGHPWFTYLVVTPPTDGSKDTRFLYVGAPPSTRVGIVEIWREGSTLRVKYLYDAGFDMSQSQVHVAVAEFDEEGEPLNPDFFLLQPPWAFGQYLSVEDHDPNTSDFTHIIPWVSGWDDVPLYIAAHADVFISP